MLKLAAGGFVQVRRKLGERRQLPILRQRQLDAAAIFFMNGTWAAPPTRDTEMPGLMAGRRPALKLSVSRRSARR